MNTEWVIEQLDDFIKATAVTYVPSPPNSIGFHSYKTAIRDVLEYLTKTLAGRDFSGFLDILVPWSAS